MNGTNVARLPIPHATIEPFTPSLLSEDYQPKPTEWLVENLIPKGQAVLFTGHTKLGKSYVLEHLLICAALGLPWLGHEVTPARGLGLFCEDPKDPLFWRRDQILAHLGRHHYDVEDRAAVYSRRGKVNWMMSFDWRSNASKTTDLWRQLKDWVKADLEGQLVILDTARQTFDGNENSARQVTEFVNEMNRFAEEIGGSVIIPHHPPKSGESEFAGSGAWASTVRSHLHLTRPSYFNPETGEGRGEVVLRLVGANYSAGDVDEIPLRWDRDAQMLLPNPMAPAPKKNGHVQLTQVEREELAQRVLIAARSLVADNAWIVADPASRHSLPMRLRQTPSFRSVGAPTLQSIVDKLVSERGLVRVTIGRGDRAAMLIRPVDSAYLQEAK